MKFYKKEILELNSYQVLILTNDHKFYSVYNVSRGAHTTVGCAPIGFEVDQPCPHGWLKSRGFKKIEPPQMPEIPEKGNHCGVWL